MLMIALCIEFAACWLVQNFEIKQPGVQKVNTTRQTNSRGQAITTFFDIAILDARSDQLLWSLAGTPPGHMVLVGDHTMVNVWSGYVEGIDLDDALATPMDDRKRRSHLFQPFKCEFSGFIDGRMPKRMVHAIPGTDRFVVQAFTDSTMATQKAFVFEARSHSIQLIGEWNCGPGSVVVLPNGSILSPTISDTAVELRDSKDLQLVKSMPIPAGMGAWSMAHPRNDLFDVMAPKTKIVKVYRLDDFSIVPGIDVGLFLGAPQEFGSDRRYHILAGNTLSRAERLVVYDSIARRVAYDAYAPVGIEEAKVQDGQLILKSYAAGLTTTQADLQTGKVQIERPFLWIIVGMAILLPLSFVWMLIWIRYFPVSPRWLPFNIFFVALLFLLPLEWRLGNAAVYIFSPSFIGRPPAEFSYATLLALSYCLAMVAAFSNRRVLIRSLPLVLFVAFCFAFIHYFKSIDFVQSSPFSYEVKRMRVWMTFTLVAVIAMGFARMLGYGLKLSTAEALDSSGKGTETFKSSAGARIHLADIFWMTSAFAVAVTTFGTQVDLLIAREAIVAVLLSTARLLLIASIGLLALIPSERWARRTSVCAVALGIYCLLDIFVHVALAHYNQFVWYAIATFIRYPLALGLLVFACCSMMRNSGYRWAKLPV